MDTHWGFRRPALQESHQHGSLPVNFGCCTHLLQNLWGLRDATYPTVLPLASLGSMWFGSHSSLGGLYGGAWWSLMLWVCRLGRLSVLL